MATFHLSLLSLRALVLVAGVAVINMAEVMRTGGMPDTPALGKLTIRNHVE